MRLCVSCKDPGGRDGIVADSFENSEVFDFYESGPDDKVSLIAQTRPCACMGPDQAESIARRSVSAIVVGGISPNAMLKFREAGVTVLLADSRTVADTLKALASGGLREIGIDQFASLRRKK